jgi:hypothetical protein
MTVSPDPGLLSQVSGRVAGSCEPASPPGISLLRCRCWLQLNEDVEGAGQQPAGALLHLAQRCRRRVAEWSRFPSRRLSEVLKSNQSWHHRWRIGALVEDAGLSDRQMQQCPQARNLLMDLAAASSSSGSCCATGTPPSPTPSMRSSPPRASGSCGRPCGLRERTPSPSAGSPRSVVSCWTGCCSSVDDICRSRRWALWRMTTSIGPPGTRPGAAAGSRPATAPAADVRVLRVDRLGGPIHDYLQAA